MKKILVTLLTAMVGFGAMAQEAEPNRLVVVEKSGNFKGFVLDNVDYVQFQTIEGEVAADVEVLDVALNQDREGTPTDVVTVKVTRGDACQAFMITCVPTAQISRYDDSGLAQVVERSGGPQYFQDFEAAELTGVELEPSTSYSVLTLAYDNLGVACEVRRADFETPSIPVVGNPNVAVTEVDVQKFQFTLKFTPNEDVSRYSVIAGATGSLQSQYEQFAAWMGFKNFGGMIESWGVKYTAEDEFTWTDMEPNTEYEVFIQMRDVNDTMTEPICYKITTAALGGEGQAEVTITLGEYKLADWSGEMSPSQFITFTPNDQTSAYRMSVYLASVYDADSEAIKSELCQENTMSMTGWWQHEEVTTDYQINPNTECVAIAAAKNVNNEWGPVTELRFTTPAEVSGGDEQGTVASPSKEVKKRVVKSAKQAGVVPVIKDNMVKLKAK